MGSSAESHFFFFFYHLTFPLSLTLSLMGADTHSHTNQLGVDGGIVFVTYFQGHEWVIGKAASDIFFLLLKKCLFSECQG